MMEFFPAPEGPHTTNAILLPIPLRCVATDLLNVSHLFPEPLDLYLHVNN